MSSLEFREISGRLIPFENEVALCSRDAIGEGAAWALKHNVSEETAVIVGLGYGAHVMAWLASNPNRRAVVLDSRAGLVSSFMARAGEMASRVEIIVVESIQGLFEHEILEYVARETPPVLYFAPAKGSSGKLMDAFFATMTGRTAESLTYFLNAFGYHGDVSNIVTTQDKLLTIKDLCLVVDPSQEGHSTFHAVRILRELVN